MFELLLFAKRKTTAVTVKPIGLFAAGLGTTGNTATSSRYAFENNTVTTGGSLSLARNKLAGAGNATIGVFAGGFSSSTVRAVSDVYTYTTDSSALGTSLQVAKTSHQSIGTSSYALFAGGYITGLSGSSSVEKYTYSTHVTSSSGYMASGVSSGCSAGNAEMGIVGLGTPVSTHRHTYATSTWTAILSLGSYYAYDSCATGNATVGVFAMGTDGDYYLANTIKYTYASDSHTFGGNLGIARSDSAAASSADSGLFVNGFDGGILQTTDKHMYANDSVGAGTLLGAAKRRQAATSSSPGWF